MKHEPLDAILVMGSIHRVLKAEKALVAAGIGVDTLVTPREVSADCGMVVALSSRSLEKAIAVLAVAGAEPVETWMLDDGKYRKLSPTASESAPV